MTKLATLDATLDKFYPVGSIYMSLDAAFNPNTAWGGEWKLIKSGKFLEATETDGEVGREVEPGLPNITGLIGGWIKMGAEGYGGPDGALWWSLNSVGGGAGGQLGDLGSYNVLNFSARKSNAIYGKSQVVQPSSIRLFMWQRKT